MLESFQLFDSQFERPKPSLYLSVVCITLLLRPFILFVNLALAVSLRNGEIRVFL